MSKHIRKGASRSIWKETKEILIPKEPFICHPLQWYHCLFFIFPLDDDKTKKPVLNWSFYLICKTKKKQRCPKHFFGAFIFSFDFWIFCSNFFSNLCSGGYNCTYSQQNFSQLRQCPSIKQRRFKLRQFLHNVTVRQLNIGLYHDINMIGWNFVVLKWLCWLRIVLFSIY